MPLCPAGQKTTIEWQYEGEAKQRIEGADDYSIKKTDAGFQGGQCSGAQYKIYLWYDYYQSSGRLLQADVLIPPTIVYGAVRAVYLQYTQQDNRPDLTGVYFVVECKNANGTPRLIRNLIAGNGLYAVTKNIIVSRNDNGTDNCGNPPPIPPCNFKVTKGGVVVYQRTAPTCPTVTYFCGEKCPPGTCECTCGTRVCCYDPATGIAVKSFNK
jgi:hypothetical protein